MTRGFKTNLCLTKVLELKNNRKNDAFAASSAWSTSTEAPAWSAQEPEPIIEKAPPGYMTYRAIYEFSARNSDEISFQPGDIVMVS